MNRIIKMTIAFLIVAIWLGGCGISSKEEKKMIATALPISEKYIKQYYKADFVLKDYDIDDASYSLNNVSLWVP